MDVDVHQVRDIPQEPRLEEVGNGVPSGDGQCSLQADVEIQNDELAEPVGADFLDPDDPRYLPRNG